METAEERLEHKLEMAMFCRVCMVHNPPELVPLFQIHHHEDEVIANMIIDCCEVMVSDDDNLPQNICQGCMERLTQAYLLRKQCQRSDKTLRDMLIESTAGLKRPQLRQLSSISIQRCEVSNMNIPEEKLGNLMDTNTGSGEENDNEEYEIEYLDEAIDTVDDHKGRYACCVSRCYELFELYEDLKNHAETVHQLLRIQHAQGREYEHTTCEICHKGFPSEKAYTRHRKSGKNRKYVCSICGAKYATKNNLQQHERSNCGSVATFKCKHCDKTFVTKGGLKNHSHTHKSERSYVCKLCSRAFVRKAVFRDHMILVHSDLRAFKCALCPKSFASRNILQSHQMTHTKEKSFQCRHCDKRYYKTSDRNLHEKQVHLGVRPFQCTYCSAAFIRDRERRLHERTHTKSKLYTCDVCSQGYNKFAEFKHHRRKEHGMETLRDLGPAVMAAVESSSIQSTPLGGSSSTNSQCKYSQLK